MLQKAYIIGDLHVQLSNIEDTRRVFSLITERAAQDLPELIIFTGDIYHTHAVLRQEIIDVVQEEMAKLHAVNKNIYIVVGNHDGYSPTSTKINAVRQTLSHYATVVDDVSGPVKAGNYYLVGYKHSESDFLDAVKNIPDDSVIVCHQTFNGAKYDNGFYAPDGFDLSKIRQKYLISGHIHSEQSFGKVVYVGTPRPVNFGEAVDLGVDGVKNRKSISVFYTDANGSVKQDRIFTDGSVKNYYKLYIDQDNQPDPESLKKDIYGIDSEVRITVNGSEDFYNNMVNRYSGLTQKVKFIPVIVKHVKSQLNLDNHNFSLELALKEYLNKVYNDSNENKEKIWDYLQTEMTKVV